VQSATAIEILFPDANESFVAFSQNSFSFHFATPAPKEGDTALPTPSGIPRLFQKYQIFVMLAGLVVVVQCAACLLCGAKKQRKAQKEINEAPAAKKDKEEERPPEKEKTE
jgi:hypothetical protein